MSGVVAQRWAARSWQLDVAIFLSILLLMLLLSPRLRVYYRVTVVDVSVEQVSPAGQRRALQTPEAFRHVGAGYWPGDSLVERLTPRIDAHMKSSGWAHDAPAGTRFEWAIRWSENSTKLDHVDHVVWEIPEHARP